MSFFSGKSGGGPLSCRVCGRELDPVAYEQTDDPICSECSSKAFGAVEGSDAATEGGLQPLVADEFLGLGDVRTSDRPGGEDQDASAPGEIAVAAAYPPKLPDSESVEGSEIPLQRAQAEQTPAMIETALASGRDWREDLIADVRPSESACPAAGEGEVEIAEVGEGSAESQGYAGVEDSSETTALAGAVIEEEPAPGPTGEVAELPPEKVGVEFRCPHCDGHLRIADLRVAATGEGLSPHLVSQIEALLLAPLKPADSPAVISFPPPSDVPGVGFRIAVPEEEARRRPFARPAYKKVNIVKELIGWVAGGLLGLVIAYYLLVLIRGDHGNFLKVPLPGIRSTYKYSPSWFPWFLKEAAAEDTGEASGQTQEAAPKRSNTGGNRAE
ncbi:MAG: hypothetical protein NZ899_04665 [Thermoguttaceae bacterium]|nr:hypothetical protein [Thermoguttaceae bacterium]MDW8077879.1 hypothetical protein [Thermoguttaceae bacterium]